MNNYRQSMADFIAGKGWEPLGYASFTQWWTDTRAEITVPPELRVMVAYAMFAEGVAPLDVALAIKGIGSVIAESLARQRDHGVPAECASLRGTRTRHLRVES
jgi:hypothetical protein